MQEKLLQEKQLLTQQLTQKEVEQALQILDEIFHQQLLLPWTGNSWLPSKKELPKNSLVDLSKKDWILLSQMLIELMWEKEESIQHKKLHRKDQD